ncbi:histidinol dehydrogenase [Lysobacter pythonis]|uniref:Histidinol dehydrogenase n=1 Tax=Solilutibacter pythonis TaxID=2483112 RepID=A0A3M2HY44_9GAMM|nr:histidinol dehydrogenase [Lysobacter pythonis]RMH90754.1 histidinol dehydrogenase [Lysobacter pythonis]
MKRVDWNALDENARERLLQRPTRALSVEVRASVRAILEDVSLRGDTALRVLTEYHDGVRLDALEVEADEFATAEETVPAELRAAIAEAAARIEAFHRAGMPKPYLLDTAPGMRCERVLRPISPVGLYVPAGSAPLPSTALMLVIPAMLAGCPEIVLCTPPRKDGSADPAVLVAARIAPNIRVFKLGGAQAIAAMSFGSESVPRCDKLFGPGNAWVDEAKRQASQRSDGPAIDMPAGPSEVLVIADAGADPAFVAADLLSQAEHGPDSQVFLLSDSEELLDSVARRVDVQLADLPRREIAARALESSRLIRVRDIAEAIAIGNRYAPEHLILAVREPRAWLDAVTSAGTVFMGDWTPESLGDYCSGSNHVLPTGGAARAWSGLSVSSFTKSLTVQTASEAGIRRIGPCAVTLADAEGLQAHALAVRLRLAALA